MKIESQKVSEVFALHHINFYLCSKSSRFLYHPLNGFSNKQYEPNIFFYIFIFAYEQLFHFCVK